MWSTREIGMVHEVDIGDNVDKVDEVDEVDEVDMVDKVNTVDEINIVGERNEFGRGRDGVAHAGGWWFARSRAKKNASRTRLGRQAIAVGHLYIHVLALLVP